MRLLLAIFLLATAGLGAAIAPNTVALYEFENNALDSSGNGYHLATVGSVGYATSAHDGAYSMSYTAAGVELSSTASALATALSSMTAWTVEFWWFRTAATRSTNNYILSCNSATYRPYIQIGDAASDFLSIGITSDTRLAYALAAQTDGEWHHVAFTGDGSGRKIYLDNVKVAEDATASSWPSVTALKVGSYFTIATAKSAWIDSLRISNVVRTSFPTVDPTGTSIPNPRSPNLRNGLRLRLGSLLFKLFTMPSDIYGQSVDQLQEHAYVKAMDTKVKLVTAVKQKAILETKVAEDISAGRITRTYTPTKVPTPDKPTATVTFTATATPTPGKQVVPKEVTEGKI